MIYIDPNTFHCYVEQDDKKTRIPHDEPCFNGKCKTFVEGYCCVPVGYNWTDIDGTVHPGGVVFPWKNYNELDAAQREYERQLLAEYAEALKIMGVVV